MQRFFNVFHRTKCNIIGMIHLDALPGTPKYAGHWNEIIEKAKHEAYVYSKWKLDSVLIENMHDIPYVQQGLLGPETVSCMARIASEVQKLLSPTPCGIQVLACGNRQALAVAKACNLQYIRVEGFVFGHVADEGYANACAGDLLRYRRQIDAGNVLILTDVKKKHSSHAITQDVSLLETVKAAEFFLTDGIIITGDSTGHAPSLSDLRDLVGKTKSPLLIGSGVTSENIGSYIKQAQGVIIGSHFKVNGSWENDLCEMAIKAFMENIDRLQKPGFELTPPVVSIKTKV